MVDGRRAAHDDDAGDDDDDDDDDDAEACMMLTISTTAWTPRAMRARCATTTTRQKTQGRAVMPVRASMRRETASMTTEPRAAREQTTTTTMAPPMPSSMLALGALTLTTTMWSGDAVAASELAQVALDPEGARAVSGVLGPLFALSTILFIVRIVMTWYPSVPYTKLPWVIAYAPTEPLLKPTRALVPPVGGVDVSPIIWVGGISFMNEILLGKQGLLVLLASKSLGTVG